MEIEVYMPDCETAFSLAEWVDEAVYGDGLQRPDTLELHEPEEDDDWFKDPRWVDPNYDIVYDHYALNRKRLIRKSALRDFPRLARLQNRILARIEDTSRRLKALLNEISDIGGCFIPETIRPDYVSDPLPTDELSRSVGPVPTYVDDEGNYLPFWEFEDDEDADRVEEVEQALCSEDVISQIGATVLVEEWYKTRIPEKLKMARDPRRLALGTEYAKLRTREGLLAGRRCFINTILIGALNLSGLAPETSKDRTDTVDVVVDGRHYLFISHRNMVEFQPVPELCGIEMTVIRPDDSRSD